MKLKIGIVLVVIVVIIVGVLAFKPANAEKKLDELYTNIPKYEVVGEMEIVNGEDLKN